MIALKRFRRKGASRATEKRGTGKDLIYRKYYVADGTPKPCSYFMLRNGRRFGYYNTEAEAVRRLEQDFRDYPEHKEIKIMEYKNVNLTVEEIVMIVDALEGVYLRKVKKAQLTTGPRNAKVIEELRFCQVLMQRLMAIANYEPEEANVIT